METLMGPGAMKREGRTVGLVMLAAAMLLFGSSARAVAAPGDLDSGFSTDGIAHTRFGHFEGPENQLSSSQGTAVAAQADGKIVAASYVSYNYSCDRVRGCRTDYFGPALARFNLDGSLDSSFAGDGQFEVAELPNSQAFTGAAVWDIAIQPDGRIVLAGGADPAEFLWVGRLNPDGSIDSSFGANGAITLDRDLGFKRPVGVRLTEDGRIVLAGRRDIGGPCCETELYIVRLLPDGQLDTTLAGTGWFVDELRMPLNGARDLELRPDGSIVVLGTLKAEERRYQAVLLQFTADGARDTSFSDDGVAIIAADREMPDFTEMAFDPVGRILVATGSHITGAVILRISATGELDPAFGIEGAAHLSPPGGDCCYRWHVAVDTESRPYIADGGYAGRLTASGAMDGTFGRGGWTLRLIRLGKFGVPTYAEDLTLADDFLIVGGSTGYPPDYKRDRYRLPGTRETLVARHRLDDGPRDADADGILDETDRCPYVYGECPRIRRSIQVKLHRHGQLYLRASIERSPIECSWAQSLKLYQVRSGPDRYIRTVTPIALPIYTFALPIRGGFYIRADPVLLPFGLCTRVRSRVVRLP